MKKLDLYLLKKFVGPFVAVFLVVDFALSLQFIWALMNELMGKGLGFLVIMEFLGWGACTLFTYAIPLATLLASIMTLGDLGERNELLAMKAAGISLGRILAPLMVAAALISVAAFYTADRLVPYAFQQIYQLRADIARTRDEIKIPTGIFYDGIEGYILRVEESNDETGMMYGLIIYDHTNNDGNTHMTSADSGRIDVTPDKRNLIFDLYNGCSYTETNSMAYRDTTLDLNRLRFDEQQLIIDLDNYQFTRSEKNIYGDEAKSLGLKRLRHDRDSIGRELDTLVRRQWPRFLSSVGLNHLYQLDTLRPEQKWQGDLDIDSLVATLTPMQRQRAAHSALDKAMTGLEQMKNYRRESERELRQMRKFDIESIYKFTVAISCLLLFFVGGPLGSIIRKGGLGTPVVISILFYLIYYIIDIIGRKLAGKGTLTPLLGTLVSTIVLLPISVMLTRKSVQDASLFNFDVVKEFFSRIGKWIKKRYHRFMNLFRKGGSRIRIVYMGTPEFAVAPLAKLLEAGYEVAAVVTVPDKPAGRGLSVMESAVKKFAVEKGLPVLQPVKLRDPEFLAQLAALKANLFVVVAFRMLPREVWQMPALGTFNLHASLLPQYRGAAPINWAVINGEKATGVTTFFLNEEIDTGQIIFQETYTLEGYEDAGKVHDELMKIGADLVLKTVDAIENRQVKSYAQVIPSGRELHSAPKLTRENTRIDWSRSGREISNLIRGLHPYPVAWTTLVCEDGRQLNIKVHAGDIINGSPEDRLMPAGTFIISSKEVPQGEGRVITRKYIDVICGTGNDRLRILEIQQPGKKSMDIHSFLMGFREPWKWKFE
ncbi:MAG: methionyl-tRNA formyltransferase [Bacteroidales bacterium]|nr:methionyl-tRNA formyltransferase [Bacteroidales bacterium]